MLKKSASKLYRNIPYKELLSRKKIKLLYKKKVLTLVSAKILAVATERIVVATIKSPQISSVLFNNEQCCQ